MFPGDDEVRLSVEGVEKHYGANTALAGLSFDVRKGEFFTLLGASGSGKSTALAAIAGFTEIDAGRILLDGTDVAHMRPESRGIGIVFQNYGLFPHLTVFENVGFALRARGLREAEVRSKVAAVLELVGLGDLSQRYPSQLSGGQQQRVAVARAMVFEPSLLLMDEPISALDRKGRTAMQSELRRLHRHTGMTVLYVTHDQDEALAMSDRVAVLADGVLQQIGAPQELYDHPANRYVADFLGEASFVPATITSSSPGDHIVELECGGRVRSAAAGLFAPGDAVELMFRPERVLVGKPEGASPWALSGRVRSLTFLGHSWGAIVDIAGTQRIRAQLSRVEIERDGLAPGAPVAVEVPSAHARIFPIGQAR